MAMVLKRKNLTICEKAKIIQEVEKNPTMSKYETAECFVLSLLSLSNMTLWKASILAEKN
jgi:hypothetical protein